jgi:WD40 repeat protein
MATLSTLPNEILSLITRHLDHPKDVLNLSLASRRLSEFAKLDGWKALLKGRFGLGGLDSDARDSVHGLTTLYRNWSRKGFIATYLEPTKNTMSFNTWHPERWRGPQGQTMGYQPSIDSYEEIYGGWGERREVLAWSAGTQIILRTKETGANIEKIRQREEGLGEAPDQTWTYDSFKHLNTWFTYRTPDSIEGRDDITRVKLLRPHQRHLAWEDMVFGTASGELSLLSVNPDMEETLLQQYETGRRGVQDLSVSSSSAPMVAAALADSSLALYALDRDYTLQEKTNPVSEVKTTLAGTRFGGLWSCEFLSNDKVALGCGPHIEPIEVYHIGPDGFMPVPLRSFTTATGNAATSHPTSIYPILSIPSTARGGSEGSTFLSGGYDGLIRLHDMRSPRGMEQIYWDPTNDSPIYSLAAQGTERIVAGVALHSMIKVFDLRLSGSHAYRTVALPSPNPKKTSKTRDSVTNAIVDNSKHTVPTISGGWNLYLNPRVRPPRTAYRHDYSSLRQDSPVYSLSIPSPTSQNIYAGLEGAVHSLIFHGIADTHPDPMLAHSIVRFHDSGAIDPQTSYNPKGDALALGMYEQGTDEGVGMHLLVQDGVTGGAVKRERREAARVKGLDERWIDIREEGDRWSRGEAPQREQARSQRQGRGRGRGRGRRTGRAG